LYLSLIAIDLLLPVFVFLLLLPLMMSNIIIKIMKTINKTKNHSANKHQKTWYKLDLSANVYPTLQRKNFSNVFRLSVVLKEEIDPDTAEGCGPDIAEIPGIQSCPAKRHFLALSGTQRPSGTFRHAGYHQPMYADAV